MRQQLYIEITSFCGKLQKGIPSIFIEPMIEDVAFVEGEIPDQLLESLVLRAFTGYLYVDFQDEDWSAGIYQIICRPFVSFVIQPGLDFGLIIAKGLHGV